MTEQLTNDQVRINNVRLSFPNLYEPAPTTKGGDKLAYQATFILPAGHPDVPAIKKAMAFVAEAAWGSKWQETVRKMPAKNNPLKLCDTVEYTGFDDGHFIRAKTKFQPTVVDQKVNQILDPTLVYPGCWVNAHIGFYTYNHELGGKGIGVNLSAVQFVKNGERLDNRVSAKDVFQPVAFEGTALGDVPAPASAPAPDAPQTSAASVDDLFG